MTVAKKYMEIALDELRIQEVPCYDAQCSAVFKGTYFHEDVAIKSLGSGNTSHASVSMFSDVPPHPDLLLDLKHEVSVMRRLSHSNIVRFKGTVIDPPSIVLEYCEKGSLWNLLPEMYSSMKAKWEINSEAAWIWRLNIAIQIAKGMHYLHRQTPAVLHNDLKSPNVFIDRNWCVKIGDFGSASVGKEAPLKLPDNNTWKCPEVMRGEQPTVKSDVFSFAVILWELYTFERPWDNICDSWDLPGKLVKFTKNRRIQEKVQSGERLKFPDQVIGGKCNGLQKEFRQLIEKCWKHRPKDRPDFARIIESLTSLLERLEKPKDTGVQTRLMSMKELKEARANSSCFSFGKLSSIPNDPSWPPVAMKPPVQSPVKVQKSKRSQGKWLFFNLSMKIVSKVRPFMGVGNRKKNLQSHVVQSFSKSSDSMSDDLSVAGGLCDHSQIRSPFETGPAFMKKPGCDWSYFFKGDSSVDDSRSSATAESSRLGSVDKSSKWESDASRVGVLNTLPGKSGTDSLAAAEKSLHDYFATESSSIDGLDAYIDLAREFHGQKTAVTNSNKQSDPQPFVPCPQLLEFCPEFEHTLRR